MSGFQILHDGEHGFAAAGICSLSRLHAGGISEPGALWFAALPEVIEGLFEDPDIIICNVVRHFAAFHVRDHSQESGGKVIHFTGVFAGIDI